MDRLTWNTSMTTGMPELDAQHQEIIKSLNSLLGAMQRGEGREALGQMLSYLGSYAGSHFAKEEACMATYNCPAAAANIIAHKAFITKVTDFQSRLMAEGPSSAMVLAVYRELAQWMSSHICRVDTQLADAVKLKKAG